MAKNFVERRKYLRLDTDLSLRFISQDRKVDTSVVRNLSPLGIKFESASDVRDNEVLDLALTLPNAKNPVHLQGKVVWHKKIARENRTVFDVGCEFLKIEEDNKNTFLKFLSDLMYGKSVIVKEEE